MLNGHDDMGLDEGLAHTKHTEVRGRPVLFLTNSLGLGGSEKKTVDLVNALHKAGRDVHLGYLTRRELILDRLDSTIPLICLDRTGKFSIAAAKRLCSYVRVNHIATVVCVNLYPVLYAMAARVGVEFSVIAMVNATDLPNLKAKIQMAVYWPLLRKVDELVFGCHVQREEWQRRYHLKKVHCSVVYNGVDSKRFKAGFNEDKRAELARELRINESDFVVGAVGNLRPEKNHFELVSAVSRIRSTVNNLKVIIVGEGPERTRLERVITDWGLGKHVILTGRVQDVRPLLELMDIFVLPSLSDTFSNAALEAMSMSKAVVLSSRGGSGEMVQSGRNGRIYTSGSLELGKLLTELAQNAEKRKRYGAAARETVLSRFSFERMVAAYDTLLADTTVTGR